MHHEHDTDTANKLVPTHQNSCRGIQKDATVHVAMVKGANISTTNNKMTPKRTEVSERGRARMCSAASRTVKTTREQNCMRSHKYSKSRIMSASNHQCVKMAHILESWTKLGSRCVRAMPSLSWSSQCVTLGSVMRMTCLSLGRSLVCDIGCDILELGGRGFAMRSGLSRVRQSFFRGNLTDCT